ncbi:MAG: cell division protein SepF [Clostridia bacterium]|nr:cell division protein SepF [Clostridia bacterium]MBR2449714.1 cell division protein SepF [Clostridia bacterium]
MGIFDLFGKDPKTKTDRVARSEFDERISMEGAKNAPVSVFSPTAYQDVETIIDAIKAGKNTVVHLTELKTETARRVLDMLSGAIYALGGGVYEMGKNVFMFSPAGVEVND